MSARWMALLLAIGCAPVGPPRRVDGDGRVYGYAPTTVDALMGSELFFVAAWEVER